MIHEVLNDENAVFCEPDNVSLWERTLRDLLGNEPRRVALGVQAKKDIAGYTWVARAKRALDGFGE